MAERNRLVLEQLPQVRHIAQKIHARLPHHIQLDDLINTGVLGLIEALGKYDPTRNVGLQSYARYRIQGAILDSLREQDWSPRLLRHKGRQLELTQEALRSRLGRAPTQTELATELGISDETFNQLLSDLKGLEVASLQEPLFSDGHALGETMVDTVEENPFTLCQRAEMNGLLAEAMSKLPARKRHILDLYYFKGMTMREVGIQMGVCESRISQIHSAALASLKARMREVLAARHKHDSSHSRSQAREALAQKEISPTPIHKVTLRSLSESSAASAGKVLGSHRPARRIGSLQPGIRKRPGRKISRNQRALF
ncbi:MAG: FliA/WhiG family RNA polymerase sigma factor [Acidobacteria bacterium]|nr:FliA/WhiG family RNA polymerase sigma factor [Acidobacteriota bacterium]